MCRVSCVVAVCVARLSDSRRAPQTERYQLGGPQDFFYTNQSSVMTLPEVDDGDDWQRMKVPLPSKLLQPSPSAASCNQAMNMTA